MRISCNRLLLVSLTIVLMVLFIPLSTIASNHGENKPKIGEFNVAQGDSYVTPNFQQRVHRVGNINACLTNWGQWGSQDRRIYESEGGCFNPHPESEWTAPSFEFPKDSGIEYLFWGGLWIGAKIDGVPFVSTGIDGWQWNYEFFPGGPAPIDEIEEKSKMPGPCYAEDAISDQDILISNTDSIWQSIFHPFIDPFDLRPHHPLGIKVIQNTYTWNDADKGNVILAKHVIKNIGEETLSDVYVGLFFDTDVWHYAASPFGQYGPQDDITGFLKNIVNPPADTVMVNIAWAADNDGWDYYEDELQWTFRNAIGVTILDASNRDVDLSYNWWNCSTLGLPNDWGPWKLSSQSRWAQENCYAQGDSFFPEHALGTPGGDCSKYFIMSNGEIDYDQAYSCLWPSMHPEEGWLEPNQLCDDFADGFDTRFLFSIGPFDQLIPGDSIWFASAYLIGGNLHIDPDNGQNLPEHPDTFYAHLDFTDLIQKGIIAQRLYDSLLRTSTYVEETELSPPEDFSLTQNYPNPFNPKTGIKYTVGSKQSQIIPVSLKVYNILGQLVATLVDEAKKPGSYEVIWDGKDYKGKDVASGIYFYQLKSGEFTQTKKMVLLR
jgi:hypothetical protein